MKIACVFIPHFPLSAEILRQSRCIGTDKSVILVNSHASRRVVLDFSSDLAGLTTGMPIQAALSRCKSVALIESDMPYYQDVFAHILESLEKVVPAVEDASLGNAYLDIGGLDEIYGGRDGLLKAILDVIPVAFKSQIGIAQGKFPAYVAATSAPACRGQAIEVDADARDFLKDYSVDVLPVSWKVIERLRSFGLEKLGQVAALPVGPLQAQFGKDGQEIWRLARGIDSRPLLPHRSAESIAEYLDFSAPTATLEVVLMAVESLLSRAFSRPLLTGRCVRWATLSGRTSNGLDWQRRIAFKEPAGSKARALFAIKSSLEPVTLPGPLEDLGLFLSGLAGEAGRQESLFLNIRQKQQLTEALQQLEARLGKKPPIFQVRSLETWSRIPERRQALTPFSL
ncbi:MAG: hypothetical protein HY671_02680 [Chloroflexi bacterium]|nr:hypothetical protein [Chloroflexota bacterium]